MKIDQLVIQFHISKIILKCRKMLGVAKGKHDLYKPIRKYCNTRIFTNVVLFLQILGKLSK